MAQLAGYTYDPNVDRAYLLVIGDAEALAWILRESRMAFPGARRRQVENMTEGDELFIYTARSCFNNPTRDRGRIAGYAKVSSPVTVLDEPVVIGNRAFPLGCSLDIVGVAPVRAGLELAPLVPQLEAFPDPATWSARLRQPPVLLPTRDADRIRLLIDPLIEPVGRYLSDYLEQANLLIGKSLYSTPRRTADI